MSFLMYFDWHKNIKKMSQEEKGLLVDLMYASYMDETLPEIPEEFLVLDIMWDSIQSHLHRTKRNYERVANKDTESNETKGRESTESLKTVYRIDAEKSRPKAKAKANAKEKANEKDKLKGNGYLSKEEEQRIKKALELEAIAKRANVVFQ